MQRAKMDYWLNLGVAVASAIALGALWHRGLFGIDWLFTAYLGAVCIVNGLLWILAQAGMTRAYGWTYVALNAVLLTLIVWLVWRELPLPGWLLIHAACLLLAVFLYHVSDVGSYYLLHGQLGAGLLVYALALWAASWWEVGEFRSVKLCGLAMYWLALGTVWLCVWQNRDALPLLSKFSGALGALVCLWMAFSFNGIGTEGKRAPVDETHDTPPLAEEVAYRRGR